MTKKTPKMVAKKADKYSGKGTKARLNTAAEKMMSSKFSK